MLNRIVAVPRTTLHSVGSGAGPVSAGVQILPAQAAAVQAKAVANTAQWQSYKSNLDTNLNNSGLFNPVEAGAASLAADYAAGYYGLKNIDPATAAKYAQKALGIARAIIGNTHYPGADSGGRVFIARGDGSTTHFSVPDVSFDPSTLVVYTNSILTIAVTKGAANTNDFWAQAIPLKVSNTSDGPVNYTKGVDWRTDLTLYPNHPALGGGSSDLKFGCAIIDWSLGSANQPANGATYYVTGVDAGDNGNFTKYTLGTDYTVSGTVVTFTTAPANTVGVFFQYLYTDSDGLAYQQTCNGQGDMSPIFCDDGYPSRYLRQLVLAIDWMWDYAGFTAARKANYLDQFNRWSNYCRDFTYGASSGVNNFYGGHYSFRACVAACAGAGRDPTNAARFVTEVTNDHNTIVVPIVQAPVGPNNLGTLQDGWYADGWQYGPFASAGFFMGEMVGKARGWFDTTLTQACAADVIRSNLMAEIYHTANSPNYIDPQGNGYSYPAPWGGTTLRVAYPVLALASSDATARAWANYVTQNYWYQDPIQAAWTANTTPTNDWYDIALNDPAAAANNSWTTGGLPLARQNRGVGLCHFRKDFLYNSTFVSFHCGMLSSYNHEPYNQGELGIWRGIDDLVIRALSYSDSDQSGQPHEESHYANIVNIDAHDTTVQDYTVSSGPGQGSFYIGPSNIVQLLNFESGTGYGYAVGDYGQAYEHSGLTANPTSELVRSVLHIQAKDYVFVHDRATTLLTTYDKHLQWHANNSAVVTSAGNTWTIARGGSKLFGATFSDVTITTAVTSIININGSTSTVKRIGTDPSAGLTKIRYRTILQVAPSATSAMDTPNADIPSTDTKVEGMNVGDVVAIFGVNGPLGASVNASYNYNGAIAHTITHYVCDLVPNHTYTLGGVASGTATASAAGVVTFTTTGTGLSQNVTLTY